MTPPAATSARAAGSRKQTLRSVWSRERRNRRQIDVYLPPSYDADRRRRYPVVYMHDGQNLSDPETAFAGTWELDSVLRDLAARDLETIVVGVHNVRSRLEEYSPFPDRKHAGGEADSYLAFLIESLKPRIDHRFRTRRGAADTALAGSSMGGLLSLYGFLRRPDVFGRACAMSPSLWFGRDRVFDFIDSVRVPRGRLYVDVGTAEGAMTLRDARLLVAMLERNGLRRGDTLMYVEERGGRHDEAAWGRRLAGAVEFLFRSRSR